MPTLSKLAVMGHSRASTRIGYFLSTPMIGGAEKYLRDLLWGLDRPQFEVLLYTPDHPALREFLGGQDCPPIRYRFIKVRDGVRRVPVDKALSAPDISRKPSWREMWHQVPGSPKMTQHGVRGLQYLLWTPNVRKVRRALQPDHLDVLHIVNGGYPGAVSAQSAAAACHRLGAIKCVMTVSSTPSPPPWPRFVERRIDRAVASSVAAVIAPAARSGEALAEFRGFLPGRIVNIPLGIAMPAPDPDRAAAVRRQQGLPGEAHVVGMVSNLTPQKGLDTLVDAMALLRDEGICAYALLVGDGPYRANVEARVAARRLQETVVLTGHSDDVYSMLQAMDVFVLPSEAEGLSYAIIEAMSQEKPVVASRIGGIPDAVVDGETAILVSPRDPASLARAIGTILADTALAKKLGIAGRHRYLAHFTLTRMIERHAQLYLELASR